MKKIQYIVPVLRVTKIRVELPMAKSNELTNDNSVNLNPNTMTNGDGSDAVKSNNYNVWDENWDK